MIFCLHVTGTFGGLNGTTGRDRSYKPVTCPGVPSVRPQRSVILWINIRKQQRISIQDSNPG